jgi:biotin carboxylase
MTGNSVVLAISSGAQKYREYLLAGVSRCVDVWLIDTAEPSWQNPYIVGASKVARGTPQRLSADLNSVLHVARELGEQYLIRGVFSYDEMHTIAAAHVAELLHLPGATVQGIENCRNKELSRSLLTAAGIRQPKFFSATTFDEASLAASGIGYPVVLKPKGMGASIGVVKVDSPVGLRDAFDVTYAASYVGNQEYEGCVLIEEMLSGAEISVDGFVLEGDYVPMFVARKRVGFAPYFEEIEHVVDAGDILLSDRSLTEMLRQAHVALGLQHTATHTELMLTKRGPVIIEVNGRLGGDLIPYLGKLATGIDPATVLLELSLGNKPTILPNRGDVVGIRFAYPPENCRVVDVVLPKPGSVPGLIEAVSLVSAGKELRLPPDGYVGRYGYVICGGSDIQTCRESLDAAADEIKLVYEEPQGEFSSKKLCIG